MNPRGPGLKPKKPNGRSGLVRRYLRHTIRARHLMERVESRLPDQPVSNKTYNELCIRNICRSPIAEGVFQKVVNERNQGDNWEIDSAAIGGWHVGYPPDDRALQTMKKHQVNYNNTARQIVSEDFMTFDYIFGMDESNIKDLKKRAPKHCKAQILLFGDFDPQGDRIIRDPYYDSDSKGFEKCYEQSLRCSEGFLEHLAKQV
ncbi:Low molecular weight phosphotyrosine protein phosphatase [Eumeta japonica]|uniref:Low molecular weight phosphotyrosine protein phosphatase n=1 Tax=Eumeta variegata TaxID=151549 RepID=A0A4C1VPR6_EUMVA|nr:Low molecular weight phosphotyrosine protein phosphatase [Eumeta japonica]